MNMGTLYHAKEKESSTMSKYFEWAHEPGLMRSVLLLAYSANKKGARTFRSSRLRHAERPIPLAYSPPTYQHIRDEGVGSFKKDKKLILGVQTVK